MVILLGTVAGLIVILLTALNPLGTAVGFVLSSVAMTVVVLAYLWLD
ncbi:MAG: protease PrsW, partial [Mycobacterium sp.]|nr:protease PrsW [Mycobacterium sp.]